MAVAVREAEVVDQTTLDELAETIKREHALVVAAGEQLVRHAVAAGSALLEVRYAVAYGDWGAWQESNLEFSQGTAKNYMRLAQYANEVQDCPSISQALTAIKGCPRRAHRATPAWVPVAKGLINEGLSTYAVANRIGLDWHSVKRETDAKWRQRTDKEKQARNQKRLASNKEAEALMLSQQRARAAKKAGCDKAWNECLHLAQTLDRLSREAASSELRTAATEALRQLYRVEDTLARGLPVA